MKIKTTFEIWNIREQKKDYAHQDELTSFNLKQWVAVEDIIKYLKKLDSENYVDDMIKHLEREE